MGLAYKNLEIVVPIDDIVFGPLIQYFEDSELKKGSQVFYFSPNRGIEISHKLGHIEAIQEEKI